MDNMLQYEPCFSSQVNTSQSEIGKVTTLSFTQGGGRIFRSMSLSSSPCRTETRWSTGYEVNADGKKPASPVLLQRQPKESKTTASMITCVEQSKLCVFKTSWKLVGVM